MNHFREERIKHGFKTQKELADKLFVNQTAVSQWERGVTTPSSQLLLRLSELYGVSTDYLLGRDEKKPAAEDGSGSDVYEKLAKMLLDQGIDVGTLSDAQLQRLAKIIAAALEQ